ncbi:MAG: pilus assembly protein PilM [Lachnospiraceae bacterium]|nr:pilus assembly protein PilM [Lachnospiraceae bacterium]MBR6156598.1 pilus assembly protein PilM [Lachnospiraceae bacterium]
MASKVLTIYISSDAIRVAEMQKNNNKTVVLSNAAEIATPAGCFNDGYLVDVTAAAEAIRQAIFGRGFTAKEVIFTVSSKKIASKEVEINYFKNTKKLGQVLQANSSEYFPMSNAGDYLFAYSVLEDFMTEEGRKYRVSAVAAPVDLVKGYYEVAEELKLKVQSIDYFGNSVIQLLSLQMQEGRTDLVLQIEKDATYVNVMRGKVLVLQRSVNYGKNAVINALMDVKKISEKDAKTLLSNEALLDQHVTADEYAQTVSYLVNGIGRAVEYHRTKNPGELLQGIKIFGEGSAIAGIEKILQRELGAPVEHFETLAGVSIKGQAALTAEEVLRYLPNIGSVIDPMNLTIGSAKKSMIESASLIKYMKWALLGATVGSAIYTGVIWFQHKQVMDEQEELNRKIAAIEDIELIAQDYERAQKECNEVKKFNLQTRNANENIVKLIDDLEKVMPKEVVLTAFSFNDGYASIDITDAYYHLTVKNEVADVMVQISQLPYVSDFYVDAESEEKMDYVVVRNIETQEESFLTNYTGMEEELAETIDWDSEYAPLLIEPAEYIEADKYREDPTLLPEGYEFVRSDMYRKATYSATFKLAFPEIPADDMPGEVSLVLGETAEDGGEQSEEGGAQ